ncbi:redoxin domain-containing protein [Actinoplanes sp. KI2]|uniref:TlpA family protein disulfide reductase n=1 Tax=Actinoplanes sp. KI2 TaxID=2983315 RepID=UPI0021D5EC25|nr:redoxin domain-containing protein [Actinoplanes sp. KI2]MCU7729285.1 redoxin domain-containing protein [Actinoplanes sp. KI2]
MRRLLATIGSAALLAGCAAPVVTTPSTPITPADLPAGTVAASPSAGAPAAVPAALRFTGRTLDGASFDAATMAGRPTILWFWAPWCATCASEAQSIADLADEYRGQLGILGIAGLGTNKAMHEFVSDLNVGAVPHLDDQAGAIWKKFKITQQSTYVFLDRSGRVVKTGYLDDLQLTAEVKTLVA